MKTYEISLIGCDAETVFQMELSDAEIEFLDRLAAKAETTSKSQCMPTIDLKEIK